MPLVLAALLVTLLATPACQRSQAAKDSTQAPAPAAAVADLPDGIYLVARASERRADLLPLAAGEVLVVHDQTYGGLEPGEPPMYLVVGPKPDVPLALAAPPVRHDLEDGKAALQLELGPQAAAALERFTKEHVGGRIAVVVGGKVATRHKVRQAITGGALQISCCGAGACEHLMERLGQ